MGQGRVANPSLPPSGISKRADAMGWTMIGGPSKVSFVSRSNRRLRAAPIDGNRRDEVGWGVLKIWVLGPKFRITTITETLTSCEKKIET